MVLYNEELGIRNEGGGFAASIYGAMPESIGIAILSYRHPDRSGGIFFVCRPSVDDRKS